MSMGPMLKGGLTFGGVNLITILTEPWVINEV